MMKDATPSLLLMILRHFSTYYNNKWCAIRNLFRTRVGIQLRTRTCWEKLTHFVPTFILEHVFGYFFLKKMFLEIHEEHCRFWFCVSDIVSFRVFPKIFIPCLVDHHNESQQLPFECPFVGVNILCVCSTTTWALCGFIPSHHCTRDRVYFDCLNEFLGMTKIIFLFIFSNKQANLICKIFQLNFLDDNEIPLSFVVACKRSEFL